MIWTALSVLGVALTFETIMAYRYRLQARLHPNKWLVGIVAGVECALWAKVFNTVILNPATTYWYALGAWGGIMIALQLHVGGKGE
jgi:hypothetical protein